MYSRSAGVARSKREPKKPTPSSASASGAATRTSSAVIGERGAESQVALPYAWTKYGYPPDCSYSASSASASYSTPSRSAGAHSARSAAIRSRRSMRW
jgi:hypothetical protein